MGEILRPFPRPGYWNSCSEPAISRRCGIFLRCMANTTSASVKFTATIMRSIVFPVGEFFRCSTFRQPLGVSPPRRFFRFRFTSATLNRMHRSSSLSEMIRFGFAARASGGCFTCAAAFRRPYAVRSPHGAESPLPCGTTMIHGKFSGRDALMTAKAVP